MKSAFFALLALAFMSQAHAASIVVSTSKKTLTLYEDNGTVREYKIAVGVPREQWYGVEVVTRKAEWPTWRPTPSMRRANPRLPAVVSGGPNNPLGARALYLGNTVYRIHGTNNPTSIGHASSSGCFRMHNADVIDLYRRVPVGTVVHVER